MRNQGDGCSSGPITCECVIIVKHIKNTLNAVISCSFSVLLAPSHLSVYMQEEVAVGWLGQKTIILLRTMCSLRTAQEAGDLTVVRLLP
jgi:hypothetical protein